MDEMKGTEKFTVVTAVIVFIISVVFMFSGFVQYIWYFDLPLLRKDASNLMGVALFANLIHLFIFALLTPAKYGRYTDGKPWKHDNRWNSFSLTATAAHIKNSIIISCVTTDVFFMFFSMLAVLLMDYEKLPDKTRILLPMLLFLCIFIFYQAIKSIRDSFKKYPRIILKEFPSAIGLPLEGRIILPEEACAVNEVKLSLKCFKGKAAVYKDDRFLEITRRGPLGEAEFSFEIPRSAPETSDQAAPRNVIDSMAFLLQKDSRYVWKIEITALDYHDSIAVPVYDVLDQSQIELNMNYTNER